MGRTYSVEMIAANDFGCITSVEKEIEIENDQLGKPFFVFHGETQKILEGRTVLLSLSHTDENAIAFVIIEGDPL